MSTKNSQQNRYSFIFVLIVISAFIFAMIKSLNGGFDGFETNFYEKKFLVGSISNLRYLLGDHVFPQVLIGKDGWLNFNSDGNLEDYQNSNLFIDKLEGIHQQITMLNQKLKARGIMLIVVVPPNKETIYSNKVPDEIKKLGDRSRLDLFLAMFDKPDSPIVLDLRPALKHASGDYQVYYKTDTHWNAYGAYVAYREILNRASQVYPDLQPYSLNEFEFTETPPTPRDLARIMGGDFLTESGSAAQPKFQSTTFFERIQPLSNISMSWSNDINKRKLLIYHDSFGDALNSYLQYSFSEAVYVRNGTYECPTTGAWIDTFEPEVIIIEIVERNLIYLDNLMSNLTCE